MALETPAAAATSLIPAKRTLPNSVDLQLAANVAESADLILQKYGSSALYGKELLDSGDEFLHFEADRQQCMKVSPAKMKKIVADLCLLDPKFIPTVEASPLCTIGRNVGEQSHFASLVESVISQQLAIKAADTIHARLVTLAKGEITPARVAKISLEDLRAAGVSGAKAKTLHGLARAGLDGHISFDDLHEIENDQEIFNQLTALWGIGPWTVDMFMMFQLGRLDIWPTGDLGVRRGWEKIHRLKEQIEPKKLDLKGEKFKPYRSVIAWYCWRAVDNT